ncbi:hypothetical protein NDU88_005383 [Pleurodeles waltl]|uniref:Uncharacterized protein n=1 Tax=Pleurodeles waltl TaxID=8319 RepID=A0AAV7VIU9_PLEWA|nr:hypothetical protein NDU88_005383 [Pleurodeles waltl]
MEIEVEVMRPKRRKRPLLERIVQLWQRFLRRVENECASSEEMLPGRKNEHAERRSSWDCGNLPPGKGKPRST